MRFSIRDFHSASLVAVLCACSTFAISSALHAQPVKAAPKMTASVSVVADLEADLIDIERKFVTLAQTMPDATLDWRPGPGVRSVREVFLHVASDNYLIPAMMGDSAPPSTMINPADFKSVDTYEKRMLKKGDMVNDLQASFVHLKKVMASQAGKSMGDNMKFFGTSKTRQAILIGTINHLHEHLGQAIAYARTNKVVPPWSK